MRRGIPHETLITRPVRRVVSAFFTLDLYPSERHQFSCSISKKVAPNAVDRNRAKRRTRAAYAAVAPDSPRAVLVTIKKPSLSATYAELKDELERLLTKS